MGIGIVKVTDGIFTNGRVTIPLALVAFVSHDIDGSIEVVFGNTTWNVSGGVWNNAAYIVSQDAEAFVEALCQYRTESERGSQWGAVVSDYSPEVFNGNTCSIPLAHIEYVIRKPLQPGETAQNQYVTIFFKSMAETELRGREVTQFLNCWSEYTGEHHCPPIPVTEDSLLVETFSPLHVNCDYCGEIIPDAIHIQQDADGKPFCGKVCLDQSESDKLSGDGSDPCGA